MLAFGQYASWSIPLKFQRTTFLVFPYIVNPVTETTCSIWTFWLQIQCQRPKRLLISVKPRNYNAYKVGLYYVYTCSFNYSSIGLELHLPIYVVCGHLIVVISYKTLFFCLQKGTSSLNSCFIKLMMCSTSDFYDSHPKIRPRISWTTTKIITITFQKTYIIPISLGQIHLW